MADVLPSDELVEEPSDYGSLKPGELLGRYELLVPIARGGMARVWAARLHGQRGFQKLVALKTILPHLASEPEFERMFLDEARIASGVHHPNVCEIYELGEERRTLYLAMEWVSGDSLARVLRASGRTEGLDARVVSRVVADACAGLHAAHELTDDDGRALGVVHRDLSPHNILLTADGTAKVADFGVAKALGQLHEATSAGQLKGKIAYMAPEQVTAAGVDRRSDVFSLGCVLYEATTGQRPFRGEGDHQVMHAVLKGEYLAPTSLLRGYPQELERIIARALSPQPILRYPTAERMRFALEEFLAKGQLVTQSNVAQVVRARIGEAIERRKERIRQASAAGEGGWSEPPGAMTPSNAANPAQGGHRSGVKASGRAFSTMQMDRPPPAISVAPVTPEMGVHASSSATIPQAPAFPHSQQLAANRGHTPVSYPGAAYPQPGPPQFGPPQFGPSGAHGLPPQHTPMPPPAMPFAAPAMPMHEMHGSSEPPLIIGVQPISHGHGGAPPPSYGYPSVPPHPSQPFEPSSSGGAAPAPQSSAGHYAMAISLGVMLAALIAVGGFVVWRGRHKPPPPAETTVVAPIPVPVPMPDPNAAATASTPPVAPVAVSADIVLTLTPADATLVVDGKELGAGVRTLPRPPVGTTVTVVARSKGHEDVTLLMDYFTTSPMELTLKAVTVSAAGSPTTPPVMPTGEEPRVDKDPPKEPAKPKAKPKGDSIPANPY